MAGDDGDMDDYKIEMSQLRMPKVESSTDMKINWAGLDRAVRQHIDQRIDWTGLNQAAQQLTDYLASAGTSIREVASRLRLNEQRPDTED
jgi:histone H3/H4